MYGDCQVMSSLGTNDAVVTSENLFLTSTMQNPNFNSFMPFHPYPLMVIPKDENGLMMMRGKEEMLESGSGSDLQLEDKSGNEQDSNIDNLHQQNLNTSKKKRYHRHTARQIQDMEALFKECPHPDDKQRMKLSQDLGLKPRQVKFWFQNRRTQMKAQQDRSDNMMLRAENDSLKNENYRLQAELRNIQCPSCGGPAILGGIAFEELRLENARLREEVERVCCIASRYSGRQIQPMEQIQPSLMPHQLELDMNMFPRHFANPQTSGMSVDMMPPSFPMMPEPSPFPNGLLVMEDEKGLAMDIAISSMNELSKMCNTNEPLWIRNNSNNDNRKEILNIEEYVRTFPWPLNLKQHTGGELRTEASRDTCVVIMNSITLVDAFMDVNKWSELFPSIVARAKTVQIVSPGVSGSSGLLLLMYAELQVVSPLVGSREAYFLRYCHQNVDEGSWIIVDFPLDSFHENNQNSFPVYRRKPSGCLIHDMPNGYSKVTWVEHGEVEEKPVHQVLSQYVYSGSAFGAHRWLAVLQRQCERVASLMARNISELGVIPSPEARKNLMRLAHRMAKTFCVNISSSCGQSWTAISDSIDDTVRITTRKITDPGQPNGIVLCAVSTTWLPYSHYQVFDLLKDEQKRSQFEVLSNGSPIQEVAHIANGSHPGNCISVLRINVASNSSQSVELMLQESCTDESGSMVVYTTVDVDSIQHVMNGDDPSCIPLLPLGFIIVPSEQPINDTNSIQSLDQTQPKKPGCLLTIGLQVHVTTVLTARINLSTVNALNNHLCNTVQQIGVALSSSSSATVRHVNDDANIVAGSSSSSGSGKEPVIKPDQ